MDILIVGTGALAVLFAARLAQAGQQVTMLGTWRNGLDALSQYGARVVDSAGNELSFPVRTTDDPRKCQGIRYAIVLVKSWQTERAARQLAICLPEDGIALTLQNGLGNREILVSMLAADRVVLGTTTTGGTLLGPGFVKPGGEGLLPIESHPALSPMVDALRSANFKVEIVKDVQSLIWGKLIINAAINPLTALLRVSNGELLHRPSARTLMHALAEETAAVAYSENVELAFSNPVAMVEEVARNTAINHSSMFQDIQRGAPTEIDAICGAVTRVGQRNNIPTPNNQVCWQLVRALVQSAGNGLNDPK
jgi:2-dehydropantoate 2-reductase